jgi:hypothetical protein
MTGLAQSPVVKGVAPPATRAAFPRPGNHTFQVRSYDGTSKCLDYRVSPRVDESILKPDRSTGVSVAQGSGKFYSPPVTPAVFLNDCTAAHSVIVEELNDGTHNVILHAGNQVIGIRRSLLTSSNQATQSATQGPPEYPLELISHGADLQAIYDNVFTLDGDSIILASSRPCLTTDSISGTCPPAPPELVIQVQNARGKNGTPLVVGGRNLSDSEFWDFAATDNSGADPTTGFVHVISNADLWNAICSSPQATNEGPPLLSSGGPAPCAVLRPGRGIVIVVANPKNDCVADTTLIPAVDIGSCIDLSNYASLILTSGITLRGDRHGTNLGPQLHAAISKERSDSGRIDTCAWCMLQIHGDYVRVTGLRLRGKSRSLRRNDGFDADAIAVDSTATTKYSSTEFIAIIDHNDISDWEGAAVEVVGGWPVVQSDDPAVRCKGVQNDQGKQDNVWIERNFLHHNEKWGDGYGSVMSKGGRATIKGNIFLNNRHAIAADGEAHDQYRAWYNLIEASVPRYTHADTDELFDRGPQQDLDMHGTGSSKPGYGGVAGYEVDIAGNTFLGDDRPNFELRGSPCVLVDYFRENATRQKRDDIIKLHNTENDNITVIHQGLEQPFTPVTSISPPVPVVVGGSISRSILASNDQYRDSSPAFYDPTSNLGVGDFDADGVQDLFLATGTAWFYAPGGSAEWRFLSAKSNKVDTLLFGDFDGDGRTDVVAKKGNRLMVSWGGVSQWELLNPETLNAPISDLAVGNLVDDFPGDRRDDIFWADGTTWRVSSGGSEPFAYAQTSSFRVKDLRLGDFNGDGHTDVFGVGKAGWQVSYSNGALPLSSWTALPVSLTETVDGLIVGDFDGVGRAGIIKFSTPAIDPISGTLNHWDWMHWHFGLDDWKSERIIPNSQCSFINEVPPGGDSNVMAGIGRFDAAVGADLLLWNGVGYKLLGTNELCIVSKVTISPQPWSRQDMR